MKSCLRMPLTWYRLTEACTSVAFACIVRILPVFPFARSGHSGKPQRGPLCTQKIVAWVAGTA